MSEESRQVNIQKIYLLDASMEVPGAPDVFTRKWEPKIDVEVGTATRKLADSTHQVAVKVTTTAKLEDDTAFLCEVEYAGIFEIRGVDEAADLKAVLGGYCPGILFPYLRECVGELVQRAGFPQFMLQPMNFEALYHQHVTQSEASDAPAATH